jgi:hypothetical protein
MPTSLARFASLLALVSTALLPAQAAVDTVGSTATSAGGANIARGNLFRVDSSRTLQQIEMFLGITLPAQNLTWSVYQHHSPTGAATLVWSSTVNTPAAGTAWYGSGPIAVPLVAGNWYSFGVGWTGPITYYWLANGPTPVSFGEWQSGRLFANPPPPSISFTGTDIAQYHQRVTTVPLAGVAVVGAGCTGSWPPPRLVLSAQPTNGTTPDMVVASGEGFAPAVLVLAAGGTLATSWSFLGCPVWLANMVAAVPLQLDVTGAASVPLVLPATPAIVGFTFSAQALLQDVAGPALTNAIDVVVQ